MHTKIKRNSGRLLLPPALPMVLIGLFYLLRSNRYAMDWWVFGILAPVEQLWGRLWAIVPFSGMELLIALFLTGNLIWLVRLAILAARSRDWPGCFRRLVALVCAWLWLWCGICWLWNAAYTASSFSQRSGLLSRTYSVEELTKVTAYFAQQAGQLSSQMERDNQGHFAQPIKASFAQGPYIYQAIAQEFPCLDIPSIQAKPILFSRLQSILGFTGMYFPFTGEANVNVDAPACLIPATIAHEMAHQRMVASELEANFVGIAACVSSDNVVFQYSGYLMGLIQLCNALYPSDPQAWQAIVQQHFTPELATDWTDNNAYWQALASPIDEVAGQAYDSFLKGNGQELGMRSYDACVDLLVSYFLPRTHTI